MYTENYSAEQKGQENASADMSELVKGVGMLLVHAYIGHYEHDETLLPIEKLGPDAIKTISKDQRYQTPIIITLLLQVLKESSMRDDWAAMIHLTYCNSLDAGFTEFQSIMNVINNFELKFDEKGLPFIAINEAQALLPTDINDSIH